MSVTELVFKIVVSVWLVAVAVVDRLERRVPNVLVLPAMAGALGWQVYLAFRDKSLGSLVAMLVVWVIIFGIWRLHFFGGGDAKLLMALFGLFPTIKFMMLWAVVVVVLGVPRMIYKRFRAKQTVAAGSAPKTRLLETLFHLPTEEDLRTKGTPDAWVFAVAGAIYLWWLV
jgi:Flp pilus assembly protein protease CpaA